MRQITILILLIATMLWAVGKPSVPVYWWDAAADWIEYEDAAKPDTSVTNAILDSLGAYADTTETRYVSGIPMRYTAWVEYDTNYTAGATDTTTAATTDTVCMEFEFNYRPFIYEEAVALDFVNTGGWDTVFVVLGAPVEPYDTIAEGDIAGWCDEGGGSTAAPAASDTYFVRIRVGVDCSEVVVQEASCYWDNTMAGAAYLVPIVMDANAWSTMDNDTCIAVRWHYQQILDIGSDWVVSSQDTSWDGAD